MFRRYLFQVLEFCLFTIHFNLGYTFNKLGTVVLGNLDSFSACMDCDVWVYTLILSSLFSEYFLHTIQVLKKRTIHFLQVSWEKIDINVLFYVSKLFSMINRCLFYEKDNHVYFTCVAIIPKLSKLYPNFLCPFQEI